MFCRFCGAQVNDDSIYCLKCGKPIASTPSTAKQPSVEPKRVSPIARFAIICLSIATAVLICLVFTLQWQKLQVQEESRMTIDSLNSLIEEQENGIAERDKAIQQKDTEIKALSEIKKNYDFIIQTLKYKKMGEASGYFKVDKSVVTVRKSDNTQKLKLTTDFTNGATINVKYDYPIGEWGAARLEFDSSTWYRNTTMTVRPSKPGVALATFTSSSNDLSFSVLIIVTD